MEADRKRSKGSFFNLFDWNGKSRKKLFASNSNSPEGFELGNESVANASNSQPQMMNDRRAISTTNSSGDFSCASSVASDEGCGTRVPGVVARLMGLDALPTSSNCEQSSNPISNTLLDNVSQYDRSMSHFRGEYNRMENLSAGAKNEIYAWESKEPRPHKFDDRPIGRFQTEVLPPKSAKSIPITSHKLLSPIPSPGFVPAKNVAYMMETANKIIEASPKADNCKVPSFASSSIPLRIRDLKQKMEAAQTTSGFQRLPAPRTANSKRGQIGDKTRSVSADLSSRKESMSLVKEASNRVPKNGMSDSPAPQPKIIEQRKHASTSRTVNIVKQKERSSNVTIPRRQPGNEKNAPKKTSERSTTNVLRKNNQKQNVTTSKDSATSKNSVSHQQGKKAQSSNAIVGPNRKVNKMPRKPEIGSKHIDLMVEESTEQRKSNLLQKKQSPNDFPVDESASRIMSFNKDTRSIKCNVTIDGLKDAEKIGTDVVSFTFTSPIKSIHSSQTSSYSLEAFDGSDHPCSNKSPSNFDGLNLIGGDALGALLDQKLRELTEKVESSNCNMISEEEASVNANESPSLNVVSDTPKTDLGLFQLCPNEDNADKLDELETYSSKGLQGSMNQKWQQSEEMEDQISNSDCSEAGEEPDCLGPSPISVLEPLFKTNGGKVISACNFEVPAPAQVEEVFSAICANETLQVEGKMELTDPALKSVTDLGRNQMASTSTKLKELGDYELKYLKGMLSNAHKLLEDFAVGVTDPNHFDLLENQENEPERNEEENNKLRRKLLFDCASECLETICGQVSLGGYKTWARLCTLLQNEEWLANKLYKEIVGWKRMEDLMVDELIENDMSSHHGKWVDFNSEAFEEGIEIEEDILTGLVDQVFSDLLVL